MPNRTRTATHTPPLPDLPASVRQRLDAQQHNWTHGFVARHKNFGALLSELRGLGVEVDSNRLLRDQLYQALQPRVRRDRHQASANMRAVMDGGRGAREGHQQSHQEPHQQPGVAGDTGGYGHDAGLAGLPVHNGQHTQHTHHARHAQYVGPAVSSGYGYFNTGGGNGYFNATDFNNSRHGQQSYGPPGQCGPPPPPPPPAPGVHYQWTQPQQLFPTLSAFVAPGPPPAPAASSTPIPAPAPASVPGNDQPSPAWQPPPSTPPLGPGYDVLPISPEELHQSQQHTPLRMQPQVCQQSPPQANNHQGYQLQDSHAQTQAHNVPPAQANALCPWCPINEVLWDVYTYPRAYADLPVLLMHFHPVLGLVVQHPAQVNSQSQEPQNRPDVPLPPAMASAGPSVSAPRSVPSRKRTTKHHAPSPPGAPDAPLTSAVPAPTATDQAHVILPRGPRNAAKPFRNPDLDRTHITTAPATPAPSAGTLERWREARDVCSPFAAGGPLELRLPFLLNHVSAGGQDSGIFTPGPIDPQFAAVLWELYPLEAIQVVAVDSGGDRTMALVESATSISAPGSEHAPLQLKVTGVAFRDYLELHELYGWTNDDAYVHVWVKKKNRGARRALDDQGRQRKRDEDVWGVKMGAVGIAGSKQSVSKASNASSGVKGKLIAYSGTVTSTKPTSSSTNHTLKTTSTTTAAASNRASTRSSSGTTTGASTRPSSVSPNSERSSTSQHPSIHAVLDIPALQTLCPKHERMRIVRNLDTLAAIEMEFASMYPDTAVPTIDNLAHAAQRKTAGEVEGLEATVERLMEMKLAARALVADNKLADALPLFHRILCELYPWTATPLLFTPAEAFDSGLAYLEASTWLDLAHTIAALFPAQSVVWNKYGRACLVAIAEMRYAPWTTLGEAFELMSTFSRALLDAGESYPYLEEFAVGARIKTASRGKVKWAHEKCIARHDGCGAC